MDPGRGSFSSGHIYRGIYGKNFRKFGYLKKKTIHCKIPVLHVPPPMAQTAAQCFRSFCALDGKCMGWNFFKLKKKSITI